MKKLAVLLFSGGAVLGVIDLANIDTANARVQVKKRFQAKYLPAGSPAAWVELVKEANCNVCHNPNYLDADEEEDKTKRNTFGKAVNKFLKGKVYKDYKVASKGQPKAVKDRLKAAYYIEIDAALKRLGR